MITLPTLPPCLAGQLDGDAREEDLQVAMLGELPIREAANLVRHWLHTEQIRLERFDFLMTLVAPRRAQP